MATIRQERCKVKACGAQVFVVQVEGRPLAVNPVPMEVAVPAGEGEFRLVQGYLPHRITCVDIAPGRGRGRR